MRKVGDKVIVPNLNNQECLITDITDDCFYPYILDGDKTDSFSDEELEDI